MARKGLYYNINKRKKQALADQSLNLLYLQKIMTT